MFLTIQYKYITHNLSWMTVPSRTCVVKKTTIAVGRVVSLQKESVTCTMTAETTGGGWIPTNGAVLLVISRKAGVGGRTSRETTTLIGSDTLAGLRPGELVPRRTTHSPAVRGAARSCI